MGFNEFIGKLFGNKATRDMKEIKPWVDKVKAVYPEISKLNNDELRARTEELKKYIKVSALEEQKKIEELKATIETTDIESREPIFNQIDKLEKDVLAKYEKALDDVLPQAFSIVKETARRLSENEELVVTATEFDRLLAGQGKDFVRIEGDKAIWQNHWMAGGNEMTWNMVHYDVQLFGGVVLHKGKIAEMATGEGKTLVATLPLYLNALTGRNCQLVTVNDYLALRDSSWMGLVYNYLGLTVGLIVNGLNTVFGMPDVNSMYLHAVPFEKMPWLNTLTIGIVGVTAAFVISVLAEQFTLPKHRRWYSKIKAPEIESEQMEETVND